MSATVHRLFPSNGNKPHSSSSSDGPVGQASVHPVIDALRNATAPVLLKQLRAMFEGADDALFGMSERASALEEQRSSFDIMRMLRLERRNIETEFGNLIGASFQGSAETMYEEFDLDRLSIAPTEELEERIAVGNLVTKAENLHQIVLNELGARVTHMIRDLGIPISRHTLTPTVVCNAFKSSIAGLDLPLPVRILLYKLFDRSCVARLNEPIEAAIKILDAHKIRAPEPEKAVAASWSPYGAPPVQVQTQDRLEPPILDSSTRGALRDIGSVVSGYRQQDAEFAEELLGFADIEEEHPSVGRVAPAQRMSLVGQMCNEILSDPHLPPTMRPLFERLRFPLIKIALADGTFFANRTHPVRRLVAEAAETAASSRVATSAVVRRLEERLRHIAEQIDLSATFVRPQLSHLLPLTMPQIASFLDQQREESETRRESVLNKVRRTVAQELEVHTLGRKPPVPLVNFLRMGWGPLMAARLLRHGMNSRSWIDAINRLVQILASMDVIDVSSDHLAMRGEILNSVGVELAGIGMREDKVAAAKSFLEKTYAEVDARTARLSPEEREMKANELELLTPMETAAVMADFPPPGSGQSRAPSLEALREPLQQEPARDALLDFVLTLPEAPRPAQASAASVPVSPGIDTRNVTKATPPDQPTAASALDTKRPGTTLRTPKSDELVTFSARSNVEQASAPSGGTSDADDAVSMPGTGAASPTDGQLERDASDADLLALCLTAESWFRVFDASNGQTLWLKVSRYYPEHDTVGFNGFDAKKTLSIRASKFVDDLVAGRSEPVNASPAQQRAMAEIRARHKS